MMYFGSNLEKSHLLESKEFRPTGRSVSDNNAVTSENYLCKIRFRETSAFIPVEKILSS